MVTGSTGRVAVIGAGGFIGGHAVPALRRAGREVATFTRSAPFLDAGRLHPDIEASQTIFWLASSINPQIAAEHPDRVVADRAVLEEFLDHLRRSGAAPTLVLLSSGGTVYDPKTTPPYREDSPTGPISEYGAAKVELERLVAERSPGDAVSVRVANAYGPGQKAASGQGVIAYWMAAARRGEPVTVIGDPENARDYVFVSDIADALVAIDAAEERGSLPGVINVGSGEATSLRELADLLGEVIAPLALQVDQRPGRPFDLARTWLAIDIARTHLGWVPRTPLIEGLRRTWQSLSQ